MVSGNLSRRNILKERPSRFMGEPLSIIAIIHPGWFYFVANRLLRLPKSS